MRDLQGRGSAAGGVGREVQPVGQFAEGGNAMVDMGDFCGGTAQANLCALRAHQRAAAGMTVTALGRSNGDFVSVAGRVVRCRCPMVMASGHALHRAGKRLTRAMILRRRYGKGSRQRGKRPRKQDQQHQSGGQALHIHQGCKGRGFLPRTPHHPTADSATALSSRRLKHRALSACAQPRVTSVISRLLFVRGA